MNQTRLKELLHYDPFTGIFTWKVTRTGSAKPGTVAGYIKNEGYICIKIDSRSYMAHRLAFLYMLGRWPKGDVLHSTRSGSSLPSGLTSALSGSGMQVVQA